MKPGRSRGRRRPRHECRTAGRRRHAYELANPVRQALHLAFDFVERPDLRYVRAYCRCAWQELFRREKQGGLTAGEHAALQAGVQYWRDQVEALQRLADVQSYATVNPRQPHC
jgi:hypothetical protein